MLIINDWINAIREFLDIGGPVLDYIAILIFAMWVLILERFYFYLFTYKHIKKCLIEKWKIRQDKESWNATQIRAGMISRAKSSLNKSLPSIQLFVALCPLLGLLGTVTGMIQVFDVMAVSGSGNARSMASGVSSATIPTMAGMVGALSGVFVYSWLKRTAKIETELLEDKLIQENVIN